MDDVFANFDLVLKAFGLTVALFLVSGIASLILGAMLASLRVGPVAVLARAVSAYVTVVRNTPLLMIFVFMAIAMPRLGFTFNAVEDLSVGDWSVSAFFFRSCLALTLYTSAFVCEAFRSGINAVPLGQAEAARAIGLTFAGSMRDVILPQALRAAVPPLTSVQIALLKNTSVGAGFGMLEATARMKFFSNRNADDRVLIFLTIAIGYVLLVELVSLVGTLLERRWAVSR
jgi:glutamate transport system permease protein